MHRKYICKDTFEKTGYNLGICSDYINTKEKLQMEINVICSKNNRRKNQIVKAINIMNGVQKYFFYKLISDSEVDICEEEYVDWNIFCRKHSSSKDEYIIYITEKPFVDNWFSHEESHYAVITTNSWEETFAPPSHH